MCPHLRNLLILGCITCSLLAAPVFAEPIEFSEVSLLVRARESEPSIIREVSRRKLVRPLSPQQENTLRTHGAGDSLLQVLRGSAVVLAEADASAYEARRDLARGNDRVVKHGSAGVDSGEEPTNDLHVFEVSAGHPINLSRWGGPDYEFAFNAPTRFDEGHEDAVMIDNTSSYTHASTYLGAGRREDSTTLFDRRDYVAVTDHSFTRGLRIDRRNPIWKKGVPYTLYPVYAAGGVSLYYIGGSSDSVKLAVITSGR